MEDAVISRFVNEGSLIALLLLLAVVWLWKELTRERKEHLESLRTQLAQQEAFVRMTEQLKASLESHTKVLDALNSRVK